MEEVEVGLDDVVLGIEDLHMDQQIIPQIEI